MYSDNPFGPALNIAAMAQNVRIRGARSTSAVSRLDERLHAGAGPVSIR
jgi:hypothetical protein